MRSTCPNRPNTQLNVFLNSLFQYLYSTQDKLGVDSRLCLGYFWNRAVNETVVAATDGVDASWTLVLIVNSHEPSGLISVATTPVVDCRHETCVVTRRLYWSGGLRQIIAAPAYLHCQCCDIWCQVLCNQMSPLTRFVVSGSLTNTCLLLWRTASSCLFTIDHKVCYKSRPSIHLRKPEHVVMLRCRTQVLGLAPTLTLQRVSFLGLECALIGAFKDHMQIFHKSWYIITNSCTIPNNVIGYSLIKANYISGKEAPSDLTFSLENVRTESACGVGLAKRTFCRPTATQNICVR